MTTATFKQVSRDEFFAALRACPGDAEPTHDESLRTLWKSRRSGQVFGVTTPGWQGPFDEVRTYSILA